MNELRREHHAQATLIASDDYFLSQTIEDNVGSEGVLVRRSTRDYEEIVFHLKMPTDLLIVDVRAIGTDCFKLIGDLRGIFPWQIVFVDFVHSELNEFSLIDSGLSELIRWPTSPSFLCARIRHHLEVSKVTQLAGGAREPQGPKIALIDDDLNLLDSLSVALLEEGYRVDTYTDGASALEGFEINPFDLAVLDIKMPRMDGMEMLRKFRTISDIPVIFLTSKEEETDEVAGLQLGAQDYIRKPFLQRVLVGRIKMVLRRVAAKNAVSVGRILEVGQLRIDLERYTSSWKGVDVNLTVTEFIVLRALASRAGAITSRDMLRIAASEDWRNLDDRAIENNVKRLRRKFRQVDPSFDEIEVFYGIGYRYANR